MTNDQIEICDNLWREALDAGLVEYRRGMVTRSGRIIAGNDPLCVYTSVGFARVSPADVRLDWSHRKNADWVLAMWREVRDLPEPEALLRAILATQEDDR